MQLEHRESADTLSVVKKCHVTLRHGPGPLFETNQKVRPMSARTWSQIAFRGQTGDPIVGPDLEMFRITLN
jgi:hypothetical protein